MYIHSILRYINHALVSACYTGWYSVVLILFSRKRKQWKASLVHYLSNSWRVSVFHCMYNSHLIPHRYWCLNPPTYDNYAHCTTPHVSNAIACVHLYCTVGLVEVKSFVAQIKRELKASGLDAPDDKRKRDFDCSV